MSHLRTVGLFASSLICFGLAFHATAQEDPAGQPADPASEIIDGLLKQLDEPKPAAATGKRTAPASKNEKASLSNPIAAASPESIIDGVATKADEVANRKSRNASLLFEQAKAAHREGQLAEAIRLANSAKRMSPSNKEFADFAASLQKEAGKPSSLPNQARAVGRLAAAVARGQELMEQGRYSRGMDLLTHAVKAAELFPVDAGIVTYKRMAEREIALYRERIDRGEIQADEANLAGDDPVLVSTGSAAPLNAKRILRTLEQATPLWYAETKNRLAFSMSVDYKRQSVADIVEEIGKVTGVKIMLDETILRSRTHLNTPIDFRISDISAERILDLACMQGGLEYVIMERGVVVTTPSRAVRYLRDLPESVRNNWLAARVLFPEMTPEVLASAPLPNAVPGQALPDDEELDADVPTYLKSGKSFLADIQSLLSAK
jgi:tetratricopeptide (TPR) repeat protein